MSHNKSIRFLYKTALSVFFTLAAILSGCISAFISLSSVNVQNPFAAIIVNIPFLFLSVLFFVLSAITVSRFMLYASLIPALFAIPYIPQDIRGAVAVVLSSVSVLVLSNVMYHMYKKDVKSSVICPVFSFVAILCEALRCILPMLIGASQSGRNFSTVLFEGLGKLIDDSVSYISYIFDTAAGLYPELEQSLTGAELNLMRMSMSMSVSLMPAIIACIYFFLALICVGILNSYNRRTNIFPERSYGIYSVDRHCYIIFNILTVVYILNFFFGSGYSGLFVGLMSALIFMFPHFAILGYRRLYGYLLKVCGEFFTVVIILAITGAGIVFSGQLLFWVLVFLGTSEHRAQEFAKNNGKL